MSKVTYFDTLFDAWGDNHTNLAMQHIRNCTACKDRFMRREQRNMLVHTQRKVIGRAYRVYKRIRTLEGY